VFGDKKKKKKKRNGKEKRGIFVGCFLRVVGGGFWWGVLFW